MNTTRKAFEAWATAEPREWNVSRCETPNGTLGLYHNVCTEKAWRAWQAACAAERKESAMTRGNILRIAVECGFKLRPQGDGSLDLNPYVYAFARAMFNAGQAAATAETASVLRVLIDEATDRIFHEYNENCPSIHYHDVRDPDCPVCHAIVRAEKLLTNHTEEDIEMVSVPAGWRLVPAAPTEEMIAAMESQWMCGSQADMAKREYKAALAAAPEAKQ